MSHEDGYQKSQIDKRVEGIYLITNELREIKNETNSVETDLSREVHLTR